MTGAESILPELDQEVAGTRRAPARPRLGEIAVPGLSGAAADEAAP